MAAPASHRSTTEQGQDAAVLHLRARLLPDGHPTDLWIVNGKITRRPVAGARSIATDGWMMPALVDSHLHLGVPEVGGPLSLETVDRELRQLAGSGVGAVRVLGSPTPIPAEFMARPRLPLIQHAGVPLAAPDRFIPGWGRQVTNEQLESACSESSSAGWVKIILDWFDEDGGYDVSFSERSLGKAVAAAHAAGRRVAVHTQSAAGGAAAIRAGADSLEHAMHLPWQLVDELARSGSILVPTGAVFQQLAPSMQGDGIPPNLQRWFRDGLATHPTLVRRAAAAGVTILAGTDLPAGHLVDEIEWLAAAGLSAETALGAASWTARETLGLPRLREGDRADLIWMVTDPRLDLAGLRSPDLVILDGAIIE